jgi:aquaporin Z
MTLNYRGWIGEFVGTFSFVYAGIGALATTDPTSGSLGVALALGLSLAAMSGALANVSGGVFNPALTLALWVTRRIGFGDAVAYVGAQCLAAITAAAAAKATFDPSMLAAAQWGTPTVGVEVGRGQAIGIEAVLTAALMIVYRSSSPSGATQRWSGLSMGLWTVAAFLAAGHLTGAAMNPARWLGPAAVSGMQGNALVYVAGPVLGAVIAALLFQLSLAGPKAEGQGTPDEGS